MDWKRINPLKKREDFQLKENIASEIHLLMFVVSTVSQSEPLKPDGQSHEKHTELFAC